MPMNKPKPCLLMILDGWGIGSAGEGNAVHLARTPFLDELVPSYPQTRLQCAGAAVGLPEGIMGNSEVGHLNIGAGRIVYQDLLRIDRAIADADQALRALRLFGEGILELKNKLVQLTLGDFSIQDETIVSNARHHTALQLTAAALDRAQSGLEGQTTADFIAMDIREAMRQLGHITGQIDIDTDILGTIFSKFCIGK